MIFAIKKLLDAMAYPLYCLTGRRPWKPGYYTAKKQAICRGIDGNLLSGKDGLPRGFGVGIDERAVEYPWLFGQLPANPGRVLDAGSALNHDFLLGRSPLREAQLIIMTLAPEKRAFTGLGISYLYGDLRKPYFSAASFDIVASVSTIEHIGLDNTMFYTSDSSKRESDAMGFLPAIKEFRRIVKPGGLCLVTVPFGRRGIHGWYQVFDAALVAVVIREFGPESSTVDYFGYSRDGWQRSSAEQLADAEFFDVHAGGAISKDLAAGARGVACIRMVA